jgi:hypothetical protein
MHMQETGTPLTRDNYLRMAYPGGVPDPLPAEDEASLPEILRT